MPMCDTPQHQQLQEPLQTHKKEQESRKRAQVAHSVYKYLFLLLIE